MERVTRYQVGKITDIPAGVVGRMKKVLDVTTLPALVWKLGNGTKIMVERILNEDIVRVWAEPKTTGELPDQIICMTGIGLDNKQHSYCFDIELNEIVDMSKFEIYNSDLEYTEEKLKKLYFDVTIEPINNFYIESFDVIDSPFLYINIHNKIYKLVRSQSQDYIVLDTRFICNDVGIDAEKLYSQNLKNLFRESGDAICTLTSLDLVPFGVQIFPDSPYYSWSYRIRVGIDFRIITALDFNQGYYEKAHRRIYYPEVDGQKCTWAIAYVAEGKIRFSISLMDADPLLVPVNDKLTNFVSLHNIKFKFYEDYNYHVNKEPLPVE
jgi:hypothetical protein